jgi:hypothetical protein
MGQYKVPQDVEAEDKIIGPLTMRQFIYAVLGVMYFGIIFTIFKQVPALIILVGAPPTMLLAMLAFYRRQGQPFEALFLALVNFFVKPRQRIWLKEPIIDAFKIEPPKITATEIRRDPNEVRGQLEKLAQIVDTRGMSTKQPEVQEPHVLGAIDMEERLAPSPDILEPAPTSPIGDEVTLKDDILDFKHNPSAQNLNILIENSVHDVRQEALDKMKTGVVPGSITNPQPTANDSSIGGMTTNPIAGILKLAMENNDLTVSQIAAQADKKLAEGQSEDLRPNS